MEMADRFGIPVISLVDTAGAYPGIGAEERGQAEAIARSTEACLNLSVPNVAVILGEGARAAPSHSHRQPRADAGTRHLQRDLAGRRRLDPVARLRQGAGSRDQHEDHRPGHGALRVIDSMVVEPTGGAHRDPAAAIKATGEAIASALAELKPLTARRSAQAKARQIPCDGAYDRPAAGQTGLTRPAVCGIYPRFTIG